MLILQLKIGVPCRVGEGTVTVIECRPGKIRVQFDFPKNIPIQRGDRKEKEAKLRSQRDETL